MGLTAGSCITHLSDREATAHWGAETEIVAERGSGHDRQRESHVFPLYQLSLFIESDVLFEKEI